MTMDPLYIWTIYASPRDATGQFIARKWSTLCPPQVVGEPLFGQTLEEIRGKLPPGLYRLPRKHLDDPCIVETWL